MSIFRESGAASGTADPHVRQSAAHRAPRDALRIPAASATLLHRLQTEAAIELSAARSAEISFMYHCFSLTLWHDRIEDTI